MKFRTEFLVEESPIKINYNNKVFMIGSCFSNHIAKKLSINKFNVLSNPYGVLYNPQSIFNAFDLILGNTSLKDSDFVSDKDMWHSMMHHSSFSCNNIDQLKIKIEDINIKANQFLKQTDFIFITFGTAWVYKYKESGKVVANCHKLNPNNFDIYKLTVSEIVNQVSELINKFRDINSSVKFVFTVSPIRHLKDGVTANMVSKSTLFLAIDELINMHNKTSYFPSYELVMDDLRDYRFYSSDMIHLSQMAIDYIFDIFKSVYFTNDTVKEIKRINSIIKDFNHRPINPNSEEYYKFLKSLERKITSISKEYSSQDWSNELNEIKKRLDMHH